MTIEIDLASAIDEIRRNLIKAMEDGRDAPLKFRISSVDVELQVRIDEDQSVKGGIKAWVVQGGAQASASQGLTHTVRLTLEPDLVGGGAFKVSGQK